MGAQQCDKTIRVMEKYLKSFESTRMALLAAAVASGCRPSY
jgi:hypothetical protein